MRSHRTPRVVRRARHRVRDPAANARPRRAGLIISLIITYRAAALECADGYTDCGSCCDINSDCICDQVCGANDNRWAPEDGYIHSLGLSLIHI